MQIPLRKIVSNPYIQTFLALLITIFIVVLLGNLLYKPDPDSKLQLGGIIGIGITLFLFFAFSLWKVNQQKQWVSLWASHPFWVLLTSFTLPVLLIIIVNNSAFIDITTDELIIKKGNYFFPHFMFFYFWEALVFSVAFFAHPERNKIEWNFSLKQLLLSLLLSLGLWSSIMFLNEIQFQQSLYQFSYLEPQSFFWPVIPLAVLIIPISVSFVLFHDFHKLTIIRKGILLIMFVLLPMRTICLLPAFIIGVTFWILNQKGNSYTITVLTYAFLNLFTILLNWNWII